MTGEMTREMTRNKKNEFFMLTRAENSYNIYLCSYAFH